MYMPLISRNRHSLIHVSDFWMQMLPKITHCFWNLIQTWITMYSPNLSAVLCLILAIFPVAITQKPPRLLPASTRSLSLLKKGGLISLCIYSGGDSGFEERDAVLSWLKNLDSHKYLVIRSDYYNRPNNPPIPVLIIRQ